MPIYFYAKTDPNYEFSNFSQYGIEMEGVWWDTVEHYFQAQKFENKDYQEKIRRSYEAKDAINLGRTRDVPIRTDWEEIKDSIMKTGVLKKFETHPSLTKLLLSTKNQEIIESSPHDYYWGCGADGSGENRLGKILMEVRQYIENSA